MTPFAFDTETCLIRPALLAPPMVCLTWQVAGEPAKIAHHAEAEKILAGAFSDSSYILVGHNVSYDMAVIAARYPNLSPLIFKAYEEDRVTDTQIRQQLLDNAAGVYGGKGKDRYTLETLARRCAGMILQKDGWRLSYAAFQDVPLEAWPARALEVQRAAAPRVAQLRAEIAISPKGADLKPQQKELEGLVEMMASDPSRCTSYPLDDARATLAVYQAQEKHAQYLADQFRQARAAWALHLSSAWGIRTDERGVEVLRRETQAELEEVEELLIEAGLVRPNGTRDTKAAKARMVEVCLRDKRPIPRTDGHRKEGAECGGKKDCVEHVCLDGEACEESEDALLEAYAQLTTLTKVLSNDVAAMAKGVMYPLHTRYGFAGTGRSTSSKPNIQNASKRPGIREAFVPRPGKLFAEADYPQLELYTLAQCCVSWVGQSKLAEALIGGLDPHLAMAATILGIPYDVAKHALKDVAHERHKIVKRTRQLAKPANFGFPGGLGAESFIGFARGSMSKAQFLELDLNVPRVKQLKEQWYATWPEMPAYFARVNAMCDNDSGKAFVETLFTKRWRGGASYCAACNNGFQALGADCAKHAAWCLAKEMYIDTASPLYNARTVAFVHDEFIAEVDDGPGAHDAAMRLADVMVEAANTLLPDVPIARSKMEPLLMRRWSKDASSTFDAAGRLIAWEPKT